MMQSADIPIPSRAMIDTEDLNSYDTSNTFDVEIRRNSLGLGFSISGGPDAPAPYTNNIIIKKVFPLQPAWETGMLKTGDIIMKASGRPLIGLTVRMALDILRTSPVVTTLTIFRPYEGHQGQSLPTEHRLSVVRSYSYGTRDSSMLSFPSPSVNMNESRKYGRFTIELTKVNGSLGFTLSKSSAEENSVLRHVVKALVKEPSISDGRIKPGDKLVTANGVDCDAMSHAELITFLRNCPQKVVLDLYRDASRSQTPVSPDGLKRPSAFFKDFEDNHNLSRHRQLRYEAQEMVRSLNASRSSLERMSPAGSYASTASSGPRSRRGISPHGWKQKHAPLSLPIPMTEEEPTPSPTVETPLSPEAHSLPPFHINDTSSVFGQLTIEEVTTPTEDRMDTSPEIFVPALSGERLPRPTQLNLKKF